MDRTMYDGVDAETVPAGAALYAGYVDGDWQSYGALAAKFPGGRHVTICVSTLHDAQVLDVEQGDATPEQAPGWAEHQRSRGNPFPVIYVEESKWAAVRSAFAEQAVAEPLYWVAAYVDDPAQIPAIPAGAIAVQYYDYGGYDASRAAAYWPGVDPAPVKASSTTIVLEEDPVQIDPLSTHPGDYAIACDPDAKTMVLVADGNDGPAAQLRVAAWSGDNPLVGTISVGGNSHHTVGHILPSSCTGVTIQRQDAEPFAVGIAFSA